MPCYKKKGINLISGILWSYEELIKKNHKSLKQKTLTENQTIKFALCALCVSNRMTEFFCLSQQHCSNIACLVIEIDLVIYMMNGIPEMFLTTDKFPGQFPNSRLLSFRNTKENPTT